MDILYHGENLRTWKGVLKARGYDPSLNIDKIVTQLTSNDKRVDKVLFKELVTRWFNPGFQNTCIEKRSSCSKMKEPHVTGTKSFARLAHEMTIKNDGVLPTRGELYIKTRTRKDGSILYDEPLGVVNSPKVIVSDSTSTPEDKNDFAKDDYSKVKGPEKRGYVHLIGKIPTTKSNNDAKEIEDLKTIIHVMANVIQKYIPNANLSTVFSNMNVQVFRNGSSNEESSKNVEHEERVDKN